MLARIPWWGWYGIVALTLYGVYNPAGVSVYHMWADDWPLWWSVKFLVSIGLLTAIGVIATATWRSIGLIGVVIVGVLLLIALWVFGDLGLSDLLLRNADWIAQLVVAGILTVGLRWANVVRILTGRVQADVIGDIESGG